MKKILYFLFCIIVLGSCKKESSTFEGTSIEEMYSNFKIMEAFTCNRDSVNFAAGQTAVFSARFNKAVAWKITITGQTSHARKELTGMSKQIDLTNATWNGSTTLFPMFKTENCLAQLTITDVADTFAVPVKITGIKVNEGLVIADFENGFNPAWVKFIQSGANMDFSIKTDSLAPQGAKYLKMAGTVNWDWLIGMIDYPASAYGANTLALSQNPDEVYFNCLIYGVPNTNESLVLFQFKEDENGDGTINANSDDQYDLEVRVNWAGWKLVTVRYSDLPSLSNGQPTTPHGNNQHNADKIGKISMLHLADPAGGFAHSKIDYLIFTSKPLEP